MPKVLKAASQKIRNLLKPATQHSFSEDRLRNDRQSYIAMTRALVDAQLKWRDAELSSRLWKDVADRGWIAAACFTSSTALTLIKMM